MKPIIIRNLNHYFGEKDLTKQTLFDINFEINPGEIVIMTGPSGSGKTTLLTLIGGLRSLQSGSLHTLGQELYGAGEAEQVKLRRQIGYIFQAHNLLPFMTAQQNVQMSLELNSAVSGRQAASIAAEMLAEVGLRERAKYYPKSLSGGQKQRVAIARALATQPKLVLADEPTAALDSKTGREVVNIMHRLVRENNSTILLVTHDNRILDIADRIIHLEDGCLVATKTRSRGRAEVAVK
jgi:putative ABC transport system ATP-binding protein